MAPPTRCTSRRSRGRCTIARPSRNGSCCSTTRATPSGCATTTRPSYACATSCSTSSAGRCAPRRRATRSAVKEVVSEDPLPGRPRSRRGRDVLTLLSGGPEVAGALAGDERVGALHFTGSEPAGRALAAPRLARVALELSGINPAIVLADADLEHAADCIVGCATALARDADRSAGGLRLIGAGARRDERRRAVVARIREAVRARAC